MKLDALLRAHAYMQVERPPELWEADTDDTGLIPLLGEMIAGLLSPETLDLSAMTLNASNIVVDHDDGPPPRGEYVALTVSGPRKPPALTGLSERLVAARVRHAYIRDLGTHGSITVFLSRRI
jgi:hypothetical protein